MDFLKITLPIFGIVGFALLIDNYFALYFPHFSPISTFKTYSELSNKHLRIALHIAKWYIPWAIIWLIIAFLICFDYIKSFQCCQRILTLPIKNHNESKKISKTEYERIPSNQHSWINSQNQALLFQRQVVRVYSKSQKFKEKQQTKQFSQHLERKSNLNEGFSFSFTITFLVMFFLLFMCIFLIQTQVSFISTSFKNGAHHSKWMGAMQYYTLDFFHNIPDQFQKNEKLLHLFQIQDGSVSSVKNWISNYRLFFGLFYLIIKTIGFDLVAICIALLTIIKKLNIKQQKQSQSFKKIMKTVKFFSEISLLNFFFLSFLGFSFFSAIFLQLKNTNLSELCLNDRPIGGFLLNFSKNTELEIFAQLNRSSNNFSLQNRSQQINKHQILFVFQNFCSIFASYYKKITHLQEIFLFGMRISQILFGFSLILMLYQRVKKIKTHI